MTTAAAIDPRRRALLATVLATVLLAGALVAINAARGEAQSLPTLQQLNCNGSVRSSADVTYVEGPRTFDTPEVITRRYALSQEGRRRQLEGPASTVIDYNNTIPEQADGAVAQLNSPLGSPSVVLNMYKADNGDWRIESIANCEEA